MFKRLKRLYQLTKKDPKALEQLYKITEDQLKLIPYEIEADGKAEFLGAGTEQEFKEQEKADKGLKGIFGL